MNSKLIKFGRFFNVLSLLRSVLSISLSLLFLSYLLAVNIIIPIIPLYGYKYTQDKFYKMIAVLSNEPQYVLYIFISSFLPIVIYILVKFLIVSRPQQLNPNINNKYYSKIESEISKHECFSFLKIFYHDTATFLCRKGIFIGAPDVQKFFHKKDLFYFILHHELCHYKIFDRSIGRLLVINNNISSLVFAIVVGFPIGILVEDLNLKYEELNAAWQFFSKITIYYICFLLFYRKSDTERIAKESICDMYSESVLGYNPMAYNNVSVELSQRNFFLQGDYRILAKSYCSNSVINYFIIFFLTKKIDLFFYMKYIFLLFDFLLFLAITSFSKNDKQYLKYITIFLYIHISIIIIIIILFKDNIAKHICKITNWNMFEIDYNCILFVALLFFSLLLIHENN